MEVNIIEIHEDIVMKFENDKKKLDDFKEKVTKLDKILKLPTLSYRVKTALRDEINVLKKRIDNINSDSSLNFYIMESVESIEKYYSLLKAPIRISFMGKREENTEEKDEIIRNYLKIAKKYKNIDNFIQNKSIKLECKSCNKNEFETMGNIHVCINCGVEEDILNHESSYKDIERVNMVSKYMYDRKIHFRDCINQFQGKQNSSISDKVYNDLISQFELHELLVGNRSTPKKIRFQKIEKNHIYLFLKETSHTKHYEDLVLIYHNLTGKSVNNIGHLESKLLDDFDILANLYDKKYKQNKKITRKNFINTHYVLFQLLRRHRYKCIPDDFNILKTTDRKSFHDDICRDLFETLGWNFTCLF
jgi:hypothetical protein